MTLSLEQVSKRFGAVTALKDLSFSLAQGEVAAFLGPNGAGKSTAMRLLTGWLDADSGRVTVNGTPVSRGRPPLGLGYLPEHNPLRADRSVLETLRFSGRLLGLAGHELDAALVRVLRICELETLLSRSCGTLSKGMRQRVGLARALMGDPRVLVLDEPVTGLDPNQSAAMESLLVALRGSVTILLSTHLLHRLPRWCGRVIMIHEGRLVFDGTPDAFAGEAGDPEAVFAALSKVPR